MIQGIRLVELAALTAAVRGSAVAVATGLPQLWQNREPAAIVVPQRELVASWRTAPQFAQKRPEGPGVLQAGHVTSAWGVDMGESSTPPMKGTRHGVQSDGRGGA